MAKFCTNCGSELNPGAKFCVNCGQKVEQEQNPQAGAGAATVAGVAAGAASNADISYKKSINDSPEQEGFGAANAQANVNTDANADGNPKVNPDSDEFKHTNAGGEADTDAYSAQAAPKAGKKFLNLGEGLNLLFKAAVRIRKQFSRSCSLRLKVA
ncbi:zinc-ribbon domain-containing protein [Phascolarctobacterium succinatutens]